MMTKLYYLAATAVAGAAVLALEVLAARLLAPALGSGPVSWAACWPPPWGCSPWAACWAAG